MPDYSSSYSYTPGGPHHRRASVWAARSLAAVCLLLATFAVTASAQADSLGSPEETRRTCAAAAAAAQSPGTGALDFQYALARVRTCPDEGPESVRALWRRPPRDSAALWVLSRVSGRLRDRRVFDALRSASTDPAHGREAQLAAIASLVSLYDERTIVSIVYPPRPGGGSSPQLQFYQLTHPVSSRGAMPLESGTREQILALFAQIGQSAVDTTVRRIGAHLAQGFRSEGRTR